MKAQISNNGSGCVIKPLPFAPLDKAAYYGVAGDYVRLIEPLTESDPATILIQFLALFGNVCGRRAYRAVENDRHYTNIFCVLVGGTSDSRKGSSFGQAKRLFDLAADSGWAIKDGLVSGEGITHHVRDAVEKDKRDPKTGAITRSFVDSGVADKRLMLVEAEFARVLTNAGREGSALSTTIRKAWDTGDLGNLTRQAPEIATGAHISIIGHITPEELNQRLAETDLYNGFANRFIWLHSRRTKFLAFAEKPDTKKVNQLAERLRAALKSARLIERPAISFTASACAMFEDLYPRLSSSRAGTLGVVLNRAAPQVIRLALIYMLLDCKSSVDDRHLKAALALWEYSERSALFYFGGATQSPVADKILTALNERASDGLTRTEITGLFSNHGISKIAEALALLLKQQLACFTEDKTGGRPVERWRATGKRLNEDTQNYLSTLKPKRYSQTLLRAHAAREKRSLNGVVIKPKTRRLFDASDSPTVIKARRKAERDETGEVPTYEQQ